jgi:hypothetical protein
MTTVVVTERNALAYYDAEFLTVVKELIVLVSGVHPMKGVVNLHSVVQS